jgi:hypothetical protein
VPLALGVAGAVAIAWYLREHRTEYLTDADTIHQTVEEAFLRDVLWRPAVKLSAAINTGTDEQEPSVGAEGTMLFFARGQPGQDTDIFYCTKTIQGWSEPRALVAINTEADELGPELSRDGRLLYFCSDRPGGQGEYDLWVAEAGTDGWSAPVNLGPQVNSRDDDYAPSASPDGRLLYFASNRSKPDVLDPSDEDASSSRLRPLRGRPGEPQPGDVAGRRAEHALP